MYPKIQLQVVSDVSESRTYVDRASNTSRQYRVRTINGIVVTDNGAALVAAQVPERVLFPELHNGDTVSLHFSRFEIGKGIWQLTVVGLA